MRIHVEDDTGFSLMELMIVVAILGILVLIAIMSYVVATGNARAVACRHNQKIFNEGVILYESENNSFPDTLDDLDGYVTSFDRNKLCTNGDGTVFEYDDVTHRVTCPNHP